MNGWIIRPKIAQGLVLPHRLCVPAMRAQQIPEPSPSRGIIGGKLDDFSERASGLLEVARLVDTGFTRRAAPVELSHESSDVSRRVGSAPKLARQRARACPILGILVGIEQTQREFQIIWPLCAEALQRLDPLTRAIGATHQLSVDLGAGVPDA